MYGKVSSADGICPALYAALSRASRLSAQCQLQRTVQKTIPQPPAICLPADSYTDGDLNWVHGKTTRLKIFYKPFKPMSPNRLQLARVQWIQYLKQRNWLCSTGMMR
jgi:hypothetical protein